MKKLFRKWARHFFKPWIRVYQMQIFVSALDLVYENPSHMGYRERDMVYRMAEKMWSEGLIEFERTHDLKNDGDFIRAKIRVI